MQERGDFVLCDTFEITDVLLKFTKNIHKTNDKNGG